MKIPPSPPAPSSPPAPIPNLAQIIKGPPFPRFALHDPCAQDPGNLITNGSMGPDHHDTPHGNACDGWTPFIMKVNPPNSRWVDNEMIDPFGSQHIFSSDEFDAGKYQTVQNLKPGMYYMIRWGDSVAAKSFDGPEVRVHTIGIKLGVDPYGGADPKSPIVVWGPDYFDGGGAANIPAMQMIFPTCSDKATIFMRAVATDGSGGENRVRIDAICMEARTEIPPIEVPKAATPVPQPAPAPSGEATRYTLQPGDTLSAIAKNSARPSMQLSLRTTLKSQSHQARASTDNSKASGDSTHL